jgi:hypothetical protein
MSAPVYRSLYPEKMRQRDLLTVMTGMARYVRRWGYWPKTAELQDLLKCDRGALVDCLHILRDQHLAALTAQSSGLSSHMLSSRGWELLGLSPIEPWRKRPSQMLIRKTVTAAAAKMMRAEALAAERAHAARTIS